MAIRYFGEHSITFVEYDKSSAEIISRKNTWTDFHLVPTERPMIGVPSPKYTLVPIPGTNKIFDATDYMPGGLTFSRRTGQWSFNVDNEQWESWYDAKNALEYFINGKRLYCVLADDPNTYYLGTFIASGWDDGEEYSQVTISYEIDYEPVGDSDEDLFFKLNGYRYFDDDLLSISGFESTTRSFTYPTYSSYFRVTDKYSDEEYELFLNKYVSNDDYSIVVYVYSDVNCTGLKFSSVWSPDSSTEKTFIVKNGFNFVDEHISLRKLSAVNLGDDNYKRIIIGLSIPPTGSGIRNFKHRTFIVPWNGGG